MAKALLELKNLTVKKAAGKTPHVFLSNISLTLAQGETLALLGPSGAGKSLACAAFLDMLPRPFTARYEALLYNGQPVSPKKLRGEIVASIMQNPRTAFNPLRNFYAHAKETLQALGKWQKHSEETILETLEECGLCPPEEYLQRYAFEMSGGELQRAMIALALLSGAPFLFADEPTSDLDLVTQHQILTLIEKIVRERDLGILLITHDFSVAAKLADRAAIIDQGKIIEQNSLSEIFRHPQTKTTQNLLKAHLSLYEAEMKS